MKIKKVNLKINYNENDKFINDLLKTHLYSGVFDGKRTIVAMIFKNSIFKGYEKICIKSKGFEKMLNEYKFSKLFKKKVDNHFIIIPDVDLGNKVFPSLLISSSQIRSPFSIHRDLNKIFIFLKSIQSECYLTKVRKIIDFESVDPEFILVLKKLENFEILISNVHGDLSPWNYFITDDSKLFIFDFENSQGNLPISYDFIKLSSEFVSFDDKDFQNFCENLIERYFNFCGLNFKPSDITKYLAISLIFYHNLNNRPNNNNFIDESIKIKSIINTVSNCENINVPAIE